MCWMLRELGVCYVRVLLLTSSLSIISLSLSIFSQELSLFSETVAKKPQVVVLNKVKYSGEEEDCGI